MVKFDMLIPILSLLDTAALLVFLVCWLGYGPFAEWFTKRRPSLISKMRLYRRAWIERTCERDNHTADATLISNLLRGALFFASTTVLILGGLLALLGAAPRVATMLSDLPINQAPDVHLAEIKTAILILVFVYAFFKFTWSAWQYNVLSIIVGGAPDTSRTPAHAAYVDCASRILALAGDSYNNGIRAYYFAMPLMTWFIGPVPFLVSTLGVAVIIFRREFYSPMLDALTLGAPPASTTAPKT